MEYQSISNDSINDLYRQFEELENKRAKRKLFQPQECNRAKPIFRPSLIDRATRALPNFSTPMPNHDMQKTCNNFPSDISYICETNTSGQPQNRIITLSSMDDDDGAGAIENNNNSNNNHYKKNKSLKVTEEIGISESRTRNNRSRYSPSREELTASRKHSRSERTNVVNKTGRSRILSKDEDVELSTTKRSRAVLKSDQVDSDDSYPDSPSKITRNHVNRIEKNRSEKSTNRTRDNRLRSRAIEESDELESDNANLESPLKNKRNLGAKNHSNKIKESRIPSEDREVEKSTNRTQNNRSRSRAEIKLDEFDKDATKSQNAMRNNRSRAPKNDLNKIEKSRVESEDEGKMEKSTNCTRNNRSRMRAIVDSDEFDSEDENVKSRLKNSRNLGAKNHSNKIRESRVPSGDRGEVEKSTNHTQNNRSRLRTKINLDESDEDATKSQNATRNNRSRALKKDLNKNEKSRVQSEDEGKMEKSTNRSRSNRSRIQAIVDSDVSDGDDANLESPSKNNRNLAAKNHSNKIKESRVASEDRGEVEKSTNRTQNNRSRSRAKIKLDESDEDGTKFQNATRNNRSRAPKNDLNKNEKSRVQSEDEGKMEKSTNRTQNNRSRMRTIVNADESDNDDANLESPSKNNRNLAAKSYSNKTKESRVPSEDRGKVEKSTNRTQNNRSRSRTKIQLDEPDKDATKSQNVTRSSRSRTPKNDLNKIEKSRVQSEDEGNIEKATNPTRNNRSRMRSIVDLDEFDGDDANLESPSKNNRNLAAKNHSNKIKESRVPSENRGEVEKSPSRTQNNRSRTKIQLDGPDTDATKSQNATQNNNRALKNKLNKTEDNYTPSEDRENVPSSPSRVRNNKSQSRTRLELDEPDDIENCTFEEVNKSKNVVNESYQDINQTEAKSAHKSTNTQQNKSKSSNNIKMYSPNKTTQLNPSNTHGIKVNKSVMVAKKNLMASIGINTSNRSNTESIAQDARLMRSFGTNTTNIPIVLMSDTYKEKRPCSKEEIVTHSFGCQVDNRSETSQVKSNKRPCSNEEIATNSFGCQVDNRSETSQVKSNKRSLNNVLAKLHATRSQPQRKSILKTPSSSSTSEDNQRIVTFSETDSNIPKDVESTSPRSLKRKARGLFKSIPPLSNCDYLSFVNTPENGKINSLFTYVKDAKIDQNDQEPWRFNTTVTPLPQNELTRISETVVRTKETKTTTTFASKKAQQLQDIDRSEEGDDCANESDDRAIEGDDCANDDDSANESEDSLPSFNNFKEVNKSFRKTCLPSSPNRLKQTPANSTLKQPEISPDIEDVHHLTYNSHRGSKSMDVGKKSVSLRKSPVKKTTQKQNTPHFKDSEISGIAQIELCDDMPLNNSRTHTLNRSNKVNSSFNLNGNDAVHQITSLNQEDINHEDTPASNSKIVIISNEILPDNISNDAENRSTGSASIKKTRNSKRIKDMRDDEDEEVLKVSPSKQPDDQRDEDLASPDKPIKKPRRKQPKTKIQKENNSSLLPSSSLADTFTSEDGVRRSGRTRRPPKLKISGFFQMPEKALSRYGAVSVETDSVLIDKPKVSKKSSILIRRPTSTTTLDAIPEDMLSSTSDLPAIEEVAAPDNELPVPAVTETMGTEEDSDSGRSMKRRNRKPGKKKESNVSTGRVAKRSTRNPSLLSMNSTNISVMSGNTKHLINWVGNKPKESFGSAESTASICFENPVSNCGIGMLEIQPGKSKKLNTAKKYSIYFFVSRGEAEVQLADQSHVLSEDDTFFVPKGFPYCIHNCSQTNPLKLSFFRTIDP